MTDALHIDDLVVSYGAHRVLDGVSLTVPAGGCVALVGESGSGKSTLARAVLGLRRPSSGRVLVGGRDAGQGHTAQMVFQDPISSLNPSRKVIDIVAEPLTIRRKGSRAQRQAAARDLLDRVGLSPDRFGGSRPGSLSGGQAQRVAIARALAAQPALLVCDEPVSSLDVSVQARVLNLLSDLREETGLSMLFISHDLAVVRTVSDSIAVLDAGRIVEHRATDDLIADPHHPYTRTLLDAAPRLSLPAPLPTPVATPLETP